MKYSIATTWDNEYLMKLSKIAKDDVIEVFACRTTDIVGHARIKSSVPNPSRKESESHIRLAHELGFNFNYLLNASRISSLENSLKLKKLKNYLDWIVDLDIKTVTVADPKLMDFLARDYPSLGIVVSVIAGLKSEKEVIDYKKSYPTISRINVDTSLNNDLEELGKIDRVAHSLGIKIELLLNESCICNCPYRKQHYDFVSKESVSSDVYDDTEFHIKCWDLRKKSPQKLINGAWIKPEDINLYEKIGIDLGKISGREMSSEYLINTAQAYLSRKFNGELRDLLAIDPKYAEYVPFCNYKDIKKI